MLKLAATSGKLFTGIGKSFFATSYSKFGTTKAPSAGKERQRQLKQLYEYKGEKQVHATIRVWKEDKASNTKPTKHGKGTHKMAKNGAAQKLINPEQNGWDQSTTDISISPDRLGAVNLTNTHGRYVFAVEAFSASVEQCRSDNFAGPLIYYFEVMQRTVKAQIYIGLANTSIRDGAFIFNFCSRSSTSKGSGYGRVWTGFGEEEYPNNKCMEGAIEPADWNDQEPPGNVAGCGLLLDSQNQWAIFTTLNGTLLGKQIPIKPPSDDPLFFPTAIVENVLSVKANFGTDLEANPFQYDIQKCAGMILE